MGEEKERKVTSGSNKTTSLLLAGNVRIGRPGRIASSLHPSQNAAVHHYLFPPSTLFCMASESLLRRVNNNNNKKKKSSSQLN